MSIDRLVQRRLRRAPLVFQLEFDREFQPLGSQQLRSNTIFINQYKKYSFFKSYFNDIWFYGIIVIDFRLALFFQNKLP